MRLCAAKSDPQGQGAAITYARRFAYMAVLGLVADADDDGQAATRAKQAEPKAKPRTPADLARDELLEVCKKEGIAPSGISARFTDDTGLSIYEADADTIRAFTKTLAA
jgi:hypothetical protein